MTVVTSSSHSSAMESYASDRPGTSQSTFSVDGETFDDGSATGASFGASNMPVLSPLKRPMFQPNADRETLESYPEAQDEDVDNDFIANHLLQPPDYVTSVSFDKNIRDIIAVGSKESEGYMPAARLLTLMSERIFSEVSLAMTSE